MQIAMGTPEAVIIDAYKGGTLRLIAGNTGKLPHFIIARPHIKTLKDLRGANFGILSEKEGSTYVVQDIAKAIGLTPADYKMTAVGGAPTRWKLLQAGKIDVGLQPFPLSYIAEDAGFTNLGSVIPFVPEWQFTTINADLAWATKNPPCAASRAVQRGRGSCAATRRNRGSPRKSSRHRRRRPRHGRADVDPRSEPGPD
jgi:ABC-type nitrate/sulfonate/bicarbonate transport system substrate-binding protein